MLRQFLFGCLLVSIWLLVACAPGTLPEAVPSPSATVSPLPSTLPLDSDLTPTQDALSASGQFEVRNTSLDMPEVLVQTMEMVIEHRLQKGSSWQKLVVACDFDPAPPVLVRDIQTVRYDCRFERPVPPDVELRVMVEIRLMGSDQIFQLQIQQ